MFSLLAGSMLAGIASPCLLCACARVCVRGARGCVRVRACARARGAACARVCVCVRVRIPHFLPSRASLSAPTSLTAWHLTARNLRRSALTHARTHRAHPGTAPPYGSARRRRTGQGREEAASPTVSPELPF